MSNKYIRHQSIISRNADNESDEDHWLKQFEKNLQKGAVQPYNGESIFDQINSVMNSKSKYPSVAAAVEDMQERSGLTAYLKNLNKTSETDDVETKKVATDNNQAIDKHVNMIPIVIEKCPHIKSTLQNYIKDTKGNISIPAIIDKIRSIHQSDVSNAKDWEDDKLIRLVSKLNLQAKKDNPSNFEHHQDLGSRDHCDNSDVDPSNTDPFHILNPVKL